MDVFHVSTKSGLIIIRHFKKFHNFKKFKNDLEVLGSNEAFTFNVEPKTETQRLRRHQLSLRTCMSLDVGERERKYYVLSTCAESSKRNATLLYYILIMSVLVICESCFY